MDHISLYIHIYLLGIVFYLMFTIFIMKYVRESKEFTSISYICFQCILWPFALFAIVFAIFVGVLIMPLCILDKYKTKEGGIS